MEVKLRQVQLLKTRSWSMFWQSRCRSILVKVPLWLALDPHPRLLLAAAAAPTAAAAAFRQAAVLRSFAFCTQVSSGFLLFPALTIQVREIITEKVLAWRS